MGGDDDRSIISCSGAIMDMIAAGLTDQRKLIDLVLERESEREKVRHRS
jgi:hypothetical protein